MEAKQPGEQLAPSPVLSKDEMPVTTQGVEVPKPVSKSLENSELSRKGEFLKIRTGGMERIFAFSDGIFAIAITLLVLEIRAPEIDSAHLADLPVQLWNLLPKIRSYAISFLVIGAYWVIHHRLFLYIKRYDSRLLWLNIIFLMAIAFQPFPTALLGDYPLQQIVVAFYAGCQIVTALLITLIWVYATYKHRLVDPDLDSRFIRYYGIRNLGSVLVFSLSIVISFFNVDAAAYSWLLLIVEGRLTRLLFRPKNAEPDSAEEGAD